MKTYYIHGWHGELNAGDDAFAIVTSWGLRKYCQGRSMIMESDKSGVLHKKYNIKLVQNSNFYVPGLSRLKRILYLTQSKHFVLAGGSLFNEASVKALLNNSPLNSHKTLALGVSVGPFVSLEHEQNVLDCLNRMSYVGFRDDYSYEWALSKNLNCFFTRAFDLAVLLPLVFKPLPEYKPNQKKLGLSLLAFHYLQDNSTLSKDIEFIKNLAKITFEAAREKDSTIVLYSLCRHREYNDDIICEAFRDSLPDQKNIEIFKHNGDGYRTMLAMKQCSHIVSMRLHGGMFAYINQTPTLVLDYHVKCKEFAKTIGLDSKFCLDLNNFDFEQYKEYLSYLLERQHLQVSLPLESAQERAILNFKDYTVWQ